MYEAGIYWILRHRGGSGGWPPRNISQVAGWLVVRMLADLTGHSVREVAADVIDHWENMEYGTDEQILDATG